MVADLYNMKHSTTGKAVPMIDEKYYNIIQKNKDKLDAAVLMID